MENNRAMEATETVENRTHQTNADQNDKDNKLNEKNLLEEASEQESPEENQENSDTKQEFKTNEEKFKEDLPEELEKKCAATNGTSNPSPQNVESQVMEESSCDQKRETKQSNLDNTPDDLVDENEKEENTLNPTLDSKIRSPEIVEKCTSDGKTQRLEEEATVDKQVEEVENEPENKNLKENPGDEDVKETNLKAHPAREIASDKNSKISENLESVSRKSKDEADSKPDPLLETSKSQANVEVPNLSAEELVKTHLSDKAAKSEDNASTLQKCSEEMGKPPFNEKSIRIEKPVENISATEKSQKTEETEVVSSADTAKCAEISSETGKPRTIEDAGIISTDDADKSLALTLATEKPERNSETEVVSPVESDEHLESINSGERKEASKETENKPSFTTPDVENVLTADDTTESHDSEQLVIDEKMDEENSINETKNTNESSSVIEIDDDNEEISDKMTKEVNQKQEENGEEKKPSEISPVRQKNSQDIIEIDDDEEENAAGKTVPLEEPEKKDENQEETCKEEVKAEAIDKTSTIEDDDKSNLELKENKIAKMHTMPIIFNNKECINFECPKNTKEYYRAPQFALNYFKIAKKKVKNWYICGDCYDDALSFYQDICGVLKAKQPILLRDIANKKQEFVEILDSSDEEDESTDANGENKENDSTFSKADLDLIEAELQNSIRTVFERVEIQNQLTWSKTIFTTRVQKLQDELEYIDAELQEQQKMADRMYNTLYDSGKYRINNLKPLDLDCDQIPPLGEIERPPVKLNEIYYGAKNKAIGNWMACKAMELAQTAPANLPKSAPIYKVKFISSQHQVIKTLSAKLLAYYDPPAVRLSVGQRVIAYFDGTTLSPRDKDKCIIQSAFYPGIIAEEMKANNHFRYLIFYDDGYAQYVSHKDVRLVCNVSKNVWEDVDYKSREFIQKYVTEYHVNRPMVQAHKGQKMVTESGGRWVPARVIDIDCSLVCMQFEGPNKNHTEWIYRGSLRLNPVYMEYQKTKKSQVNRVPVSRLPRRTEPFIRYTEDEESISSMGAQASAQNQLEPTGATRAPPVRHLNANTIYLEDENKSKGKVIYFTPKRQWPTKPYRRHNCGPSCLFVVPHNLNGYSPLAKPLLSGWERIFICQKAKKIPLAVNYRGPCGKMFRNMKEVHHYLRLTKNNLNVECFDFHTETNCLAEFEADNVIMRKRDISNGQEKVPLPLVNYYDDTLPECVYSAKVIPTEGVNINTDANFLICCDCEDDCVDKQKCACWQLTIDGAKNINPEAKEDLIGYQYKRLYEHLPSGIYECNSRCKCKSHCVNRVVQHSLEMKLQVFKTTNRGWGLRCLNDVPQGSFICIYAGNLLTEAKANEDGLEADDEYFAELDYIETVEQLKEGYESDVEPPDNDEDDAYVPDDNDDDEFRPSRSYMNRLKRSDRGSNEGERKAINFNPNVSMEADTKKERPTVRQLFGKDEAVYVMDAKKIGNLGRYFNHSCSPNLFVQNVFVDTHDIRFPWVAFFASTHIRAGTELTWNYNYEVGVVPGKVLFCQCGAANCRQRLL